MSYMPAELDDDFDYEDGFLVGDEDILNSETKFQPQSEPQFQPRPLESAQSESLSPSNQSSPQSRHTNYSHDCIPDNMQPYVQELPNVKRNGTNSLVQSNSSFPVETNKFGKPKSQHTSQRSKSWKGSSLPSSSFAMPSSPNILTEEDFKIASVKGNTCVVLNCLQQGFAINEVLPCGWTPLMYACNHSKSHVVELLLKEGGDPSYHVDMYTPLMCACSTSALGAERLDCVKMLVSAGVDVNARDRHHSTALMHASRLGYLDLVEYLIEKGAMVNEQDSRGWTALTWSVQRGHKEVALTLLESGADSNIKHADRLTVKDMAAHMPTDEMLALLERRPVISSSGGGDMTEIGIEGRESFKRDPALFATHSILGDGDSSARSTDLRFGEMEIFLLGLDLPHLVPLFQRHLIDLFLLLDMTEQDLINAGVEQVGARKKILDASQGVHKKNWEGSSLVSVHFNKQICCSDALAMVANVSKHIRYINSTIVYIKQHLEHHPLSVIHATDRASPTQLVRHVADTSKHVQTLDLELSDLQKNLIQEMKKVDVDPPDLIPSQTSAHASFWSTRRRREMKKVDVDPPDLIPSQTSAHASFWSTRRRRVCISCGFIVAATGLGYVWQRNGKLTDHLHSLLGDGWHKLLG